jgi:hypothetical protein
MDVDALRQIGDVCFWLILGARFFQVVYSLPGRGQRMSVVDMLQPVVFVACFFYAVVCFAEGKYISGAGYSALAFWEFWTWWNDEDRRRRRKKLLDKIKRRVALVAGRTKVVEA